jgi:hypothetical protein
MTFWNMHKYTDKEQINGWQGLHRGIDYKGIAYSMREFFWGGESRALGVLSTYFTTEHM